MKVETVRRRVVRRRVMEGIAGTAAVAVIAVAIPDGRRSARPHRAYPEVMAITPDGKTAYVVNSGSGTVTRISTATNTAGRPIHVGHAFAITG